MQNSSIMKSAFHKSAAIKGNPIHTLFDGVARAGKSEGNGRFDVADAIGGIAKSKITMDNYLGEKHIDLHHLRKEADSRKILSDAFTGYTDDKINRVLKIRARIKSDSGSYWHYKQKQ